MRALSEMPTFGALPADAAHNPWRFCVAPMLDWTDRHCRYFHRLLSDNARLYSEMVTIGAMLHGNKPRHLRFDKAEHPVITTGLRFGF